MELSKSDKIGTQQHYRFQLLQRPWASPDSKPTAPWTWDKHTGKVFQNSIARTGCEKGFFDCTAPDGTLATVDDYRLHHFENPAAPLINRIRENRRLDLKNSEARVLARFIGALLFGSPTQKRASKEEFLHTAKSKPERLAKFKLQGTEEEAAAIFSITSVQGPVLGENTLISKIWMLRQPSQGRRYISCDSSAAANNEISVQPDVIDLGLGARGVQIFVPLAPDLLLHLCCPLFVRECIAAEKMASHDVDSRLPITDTVEQTYTANLVQVVSAERFLYATRKEDFVAPKQWLDEHPDFQRGPRSMDHCRN